MEFKNLTPNVKIPALGLGTWKMGGYFQPDRSKDSVYIEAITYAIKNGITHIDTAELYGAGHAEELVGRAIKNFKRSEIFLTTKVSPHHLSYKGIIDACARSLKRLDTLYVDLYLIHWPNPIVSMKNAMKAFDDLVKDKKIRFIGVSNFSARQLQNAQEFTQNKIVCNQVHYSLLTQNPKHELLPYSQKEKIILTAYSPLEQGEVIERGRETLEKVGAKYSKASVQVALRWLLDQHQVITIPKASSKEHIDEILGSLSWKLRVDDRELLANEFNSLI